MTGNFFSESVQKDLKIIGWYQIIGSLIGLFVLTKALSTGIRYSDIGMILYGFVFILFGLSALCGWLCIKGNKNAIVFSFVNQCLQSTMFSIGGVYYCYLAGFYIVTGPVIGDSFHIYFDWGFTKFQLFFNSANDTNFIAFNFPALLLTYWLYRLKKQAMLEKAITEADSIGAS